MRIWISLILPFISATVCAQGFDTSYFYVGKKVGRDRANEYRVVSRVPKAGLFSVREFDLSDRLKFEGKSSWKDSMVYETQGTYYLAGVGKESEGLFVKGRKQGLWIHYYPETGQLKREIAYSAGKKNGLLKTYYPDGKLKRDQVFANDSAISGRCYTEDGRVRDCPPYEIAPVFPGDAQKFVAGQIRYPDSARYNGIVGRVIVRFVVTEDGSIGETFPSKSVHPLLDEEVMRAIRLMPRWSPAFVDEEAVRSYFSLPIAFRLD